MSWLQLHLHTQCEHTERLSDFLENADALSVTWQPIAQQAEDALYEPDIDSTPLWQQVKVSALFAENIALPPLLDALAKEFGKKIIVACHYEIVNEQAWERIWLNEFKPMRFGKRLWICPTAYQPPDNTAVNISLDPGLAFGTGTHPSTALCLEWLDANVIQDKTVIDYGCGSGILAIAALKLGAKKAIAVDYDPQALTATATNAKQNQLSWQLTCVLPSALQGVEPVDILLANILAQPLIELASYFKSIIKPAGQLVLAGILKQQVLAVQQAYSDVGFNITDVLYQQDWACVTGSA